MTNYEILKMNYSLLKLLTKNCISPNDVNNIAVFEEFNQMKEQGLKVRYIAITLAEKYGMSDRAIFKIVKRLNKQLSL